MLIRNLHSNRVRAVRPLALDPLDEPSEHAPGGAAGALAGDGGQLPRVLLLHAEQRGQR